MSRVQPAHRCQLQISASLQAFRFGNPIPLSLETLHAMTDSRIFSIEQNDRRSASRSSCSPVLGFLRPRTCSVSHWIERLGRMQIHRNEGLQARLKASWEAPLEVEEQRQQSLSTSKGLGLDCQAVRVSISLAQQQPSASHGGLFAN